MGGAAGVTGSMSHATLTHAISGCGNKKVIHREKEKSFSPASCLQSFDYKNETLDSLLPAVFFL